MVHTEGEVESDARKFVHTPVQEQTFGRRILYKSINYPRQQRTKIFRLMN